MTELATPLVAATPEDTSRLWETAANARNLDALMTLFEPGAASATSATEAIQGADAIREYLGGLLAMELTLKLTPTLVLNAGDLAQVFGDWSGEGKGPDGAPMSMSGRYVDTLRRQPDGRWLFIIDNAWI
jgi:ketosteroid isomerase-like protein